MDPHRAKTDPPLPRWPRRVLWFVAIWAMSVTTLALISYGLRLWIAPA